MVVDATSHPRRAQASDTPFDLIFGALAHPTRRAILWRLRSGPASVGELAEPFRVSQQAISKQIAVLRKAGLVTQRKQGRESLCELRSTPLEQADGWIALYRPLWDERFGKLADYLGRTSNDG
jgi:DNA-binding transcriptional ArsR family regulator